MKRRRVRGLLAVGYVIAVVLLTLAAASDPTPAYYVRAVVLLPLSLPLLVLDYGVVLLFGPDPNGLAPTLFVCLTATVAAVVQVLGALALIDQRNSRRAPHG